MTSLEDYSGSCLGYLLAGVLEDKIMLERIVVLSSDRVIFSGVRLLSLKE